MSWTRHVIIATTIALTGGLIGSGLSALLAAQLALRPLALAGQPPSPGAAVSEPGVLAGRLFPPIEPGIAGPTPAGEATAPCEHEWTLVGVVRDRRSPERSIVAVHAPDGAAILAMGTRHGTRTLVEVTSTEARLRSDDGTECTLGMFDERALTNASLPPERSPATRRPPQVSRIADDHYRIGRRALEETQTSEAGVVIRPAFTEGEMIGARVFGVRRGGLLHEAGIRNGDVIRAVDGAAVTSPSVGLEAYGRLMRGEAVQITVERDGQRRSMTYEVL